MAVGLLGLQGAFQDHIPHLRGMGVAHRVVRAPSDLALIDGLIIPGGESTVMEKFLREFKMIEPLRDRIACGMPVWGACAGAILLASRVDGHPGPLGALDIDVVRNAYGRQLESRRMALSIPLLGRVDFPGIFIRAPRILRVGPAVAVHCRRDGDPVFVQQGAVMATTFHPELTDDGRFHEYFSGIAPDTDTDSNPNPKGVGRPLLSLLV